MFLPRCAGEVYFSLQPWTVSGEAVLTRRATSIRLILLAIPVWPRCRWRTWPISTETPPRREMPRNWDKLDWWRRLPPPPGAMIKYPLPSRRSPFAKILNLKLWCFSFIYWGKNCHRQLKTYTIPGWRFVLALLDPMFSRFCICALWQKRNHSLRRWWVDFVYILVKFRAFATVLNSRLRRVLYPSPTTTRFRPFSERCFGKSIMCLQNHQCQVQTILWHKIWRGVVFPLLHRLKRLNL